MAATLLTSTDIVDVRIDADDDDLYVGPNGPEVWGGPLAIRQLVLIRIRLFLNEWFYNKDAGFPWFQEFLGKKYDQQLLQQRLTETIMATPGIVAVLTLECEFDPTERKATGRATLQCAFGDTIAVEF